MTSTFKHGVESVPPFLMTTCPDRHPVQTVACTATTERYREGYPFRSICYYSFVIRGEGGHVVFKAGGEFGREQGDQ